MYSKNSQVLSPPLATNHLSPVLFFPFATYKIFLIKQIFPGATTSSAASKQLFSHWILIFVLN